MEYVKDPLTQEIDTMAIIGQLLGKLPDAAARQRVLKWAVERYGADVMTQSTERALAPQSAVREDAGLSVDSLRDIFAAA